MHNRFIHYLVEYGKLLILIVDIIIVAVMTLLIIFTTIIIVRDLSHIWTYEEATIAELQITINDVFMLIIFAEIIRSVIVGRRRPEMYLVGIAEVGFVIAIREIIVSVVLGTKNDLILSSLASLIMAIVLMIIYKWILPHRDPVHITRKYVDQREAKA
ncbi:MAG: hypothetical protein J7L82_00480 [Staphylothermus sp.]|nr:hypothetical protein [Staphylothermus sp.]